MYETYMVNGKSKDALTHRFQCRSFTNANTREKVEDVCHCIKTFPHVLFFQQARLILRTYLNTEYLVTINVYFLSWCTQK